MLLHNNYINRMIDI